LRTALRHVAAFAAFALFAIVWSFPLVLHLSTHVPGPGAGDNLQFLWNFWWMRFALAGGLDPFHTSYLFVPVGVDLTLHTHTALATGVGATALAKLPIATAMNLTILASLAMNGFCAYLLAWRVSRDYGASLIAGLIFGGSPMIAGHLNGHFNLTSAWVIPLVALAALDLARGSIKSGLVAGVALGLAVYVDYYYVVYGFALAACLIVLNGCDWSIAKKVRSPSPSWPTRLFGVLIAIDIVLILAIASSGGFAFYFGAREVSMRSLFNPLQVLWLLVAAWLMFRYRPRITLTSRIPWRSAVPAIAVMLLVFAAVATPILWRGLALLRSGEYVTQQYFWRSAPTGIDPGTMVMGPPAHGVVQRMYAALAIDPIESVAWPGIAPMLLAAAAWRRNRTQPSREFKLWAALGAIFLIWSLGPHLVLFGVNTAMILPQTLLRYVPIVNNARIPGRAVIVSYLALSMLAAIALASMRGSAKTRPLMLLGVAIAIVLDFLPAPFPLTPLERPAIYETLRDRPEPGAVLELPLGIHDGFGQRGSFDERSFLYQTIHQRPIVGGYVSRLSPAIARTYAADPLINALLELSEPVLAVDSDLSVPDPNAALARLRANNVAFVVVNTTLASQRLKDFVAMLPLQLIAEDSERRLYRSN